MRLRLAGAVVVVLLYRYRGHDNAVAAQMAAGHKQVLQGY
jgi:hypothetical protein